MVPPDDLRRLRRRDAPHVGHSVSSTLASFLFDLGVRRSFGILGGAILPVFDALQRVGLDPTQFRHEAGAAFAAAEHELAGGGPVAVFTTTGPGLTNALTGVAAARAEGARMIVLSGSTAAARRGRYGFQPTSAEEMANQGLFAGGGWFDYATTIESPEMLPTVLRRLDEGMRRPHGFVAHVSIPLSVQSAEVGDIQAPPPIASAPPSASPEIIRLIADVVRDERTVLWLGHGARGAAPQIRRLVSRLPNVRVMSSARGAGIVPARDGRFLGITGFGGTDDLAEALEQFDPGCTLILGSRLGEFTSFWDPRLLRGRAVHVDLDSRAFGAAYPHHECLGVSAEIGAFVEQLNEHFAREVVHTAPRRAPRNRPRSPRSEALVRPRFLMAELQRRVLDATDIPIASEAGNAFLWATHCLDFDRPMRHRTSMSFGSMGHFASGVVGTALARNAKALAIVGDGSMLMNNEISTAVQLGAKAIWVVLNDARLGLVDDGMQGLGYPGGTLDFPRCDFASIARAMGGAGFRVDRETQLPEALDRALASDRPFVIDVMIDPTRPAPFGSRNASIAAQSR